MKQKRKTEWWALRTLDDMKAAARVGVGAAIFCGTATIAVATLNLIGVTDQFMHIDAGAYVDAVVWMVVAFFLWRMSRVAALVAVAEFVLGKAIQIANHDLDFGGGVLAIAMTLLFIHTVRATFKYHRMAEPETDSSQRTAIDEDTFCGRCGNLLPTAMVRGNLDDSHDRTGA